MVGMKLRPVTVLGLLALVAAACGPSRPTDTPAATSAPPAPSTSAGGPVTPGPSVTSSPGPSSRSSWATYDGDRSRQGLDATAPAASAPTRVWSSPPLDGKVYAQPLVVGATVYVATEADTVYALDAATGAVRWSRHLGAPVAGSSLPCGNIDPSGITGTPVVDAASATLWVVTFSAPGRHTLWALDTSNGAVRSSRPADPPGSDPLAEQQRAALTLDAGRVYVSYGGLFGDCSDYHGWVVGLPTSGSGPDVYFETPTARQGGIWAPPGPAVSADGSLYVATGNGTPATAVDDANSVLRLSPSLQVESRFAPTDFAHLSENDVDLGSTSPALLGGGLVFEVGKAGVGYLLDASRLGGVGGQLASARVCSGGFGGDAVDADVVVFSCFDSLTAIKVTPAAGGGHPGLAVAWQATGISPGPPVVAGGVVWTVDRGGALVGVSEKTGAARYRVPLTTAGSFPTLAAVGARLYVATGSAVSAFAGA